MLLKRTEQPTWGNLQEPFSDAACWSLYASKNMMTGEGGVVTTNNDQIDETLRMIRTHGEKAKYCLLMLGTNYRMSEIEAAIGNVQLEKLPSFVAKRRQNAQQLTKILQKNQQTRFALRIQRSPAQLVPLHCTTKRRHRETERNKLFRRPQEAKGIGAEAYYVNPCASDAVLPRKLWRRQTARNRESRQTSVLAAHSPRSHRGTGSISSAKQF